MNEARLDDFPFRFKFKQERASFIGSKKKSFDLRQFHYMFTYHVNNAKFHFLE